MEEQLLIETKNIMLIRYSKYADQLASINILYRSNLKYHTAATDGKDIYVDPDYFASLTIEERIFLIAHELFHIKFLHMYRLKKDGVKKNPDVWNEATDAIINANLVRDGLPIKEGYISRPDALQYSAEELYEIILKEKETGQNSESDSNQPENFTWKDDHSLWEEAFEKMEKKEASPIEGEIPNSIDENKEMRENREERLQKAKEQLEKMKEQVLQKAMHSAKIEIGSVGTGNEVVDWELLLRREFEQEEMIWSRRRSIAENNYAYRLEEQALNEDAETEVLIDVSGSVHLGLVKSFLRIIKTILKHSKLRVGCFNKNYYGMVEIKSEYDIDHFVIPPNARGSAAWTEDWDLAVRSFTKKREINKIIFTDGFPYPGKMPGEDLKNENIIWIVYGNKDFRPCCGKVILITKEQLAKLCTVQISETGKTK